VRVEKQGNIIPVYVELPADTLTPCMAYLRIAKDSTHSFLLESVGGETVARWSFVGAGMNYISSSSSSSHKITCTDPVKVLKTGPNEEHTGDPMTLLASALAAHRYIALPAIPTFTGGAIGYVAYDCVHHFEPATARTDLADPLGIPEAVFMLAHTLLVFDHLFQTVRVVSHVVCPEDADADTLRTHYAGAVAQARVLAGVLVASGPHADVLQGPITLGHEAVSNVGKAGYETFVTALKARIVAGDIIQAVPSQRLARRTDLHPFNAYRRLRQVNPSPYMFYLDVGGHQIVGASPETLCRVERRRVFNHAIAGTIRRGKTDEEDRELARELSGSEKDRAEHIMLVDLARNDVNRVCEPETVKVDHLMKVEKFSHVMHLTSQVSGILREDKTRSVNVECEINLLT
jgi:anthranilate synthase component 1